MKRYSPFLAVFGGYLWLIFATLHPTLPSQKSPLIFYSNQLRDDLKQVTLQALKSAKKSITIQIYGLTDEDVLTLLKKKVDEGVEVAIFYDPSASKSLPQSLPSFPVKTGGLMHRKILVIDERLILLGTANLTSQSLKMHDNLVLGIWDPQFAHFLSASRDDQGNFEVGGCELTTFLLPDFEEKGVNELVGRIGKAQKEIQVAMFTLTHPKIVDRLVGAIQRGVKVSIAIDRYTALGASLKAITKLKMAGAEILTSTGSQLLHHKWALIDSDTLILGSANWTQSAFSRNQDCLLVIDGLKKGEKRQIKRLWKAIAIASEKG